MKYIAMCVFLFLTACTTTPPVPQTPRQMHLAAQEMLLTYIDAANNAYAAKIIDTKQYAHLIERANTAFAYLENARLFLAGTPPSELVCANTTSCLQLAQKVLTEIQNDLPKEKTP